MLVDYFRNSLPSDKDKMGTKIQILDQIAFALKQYLLTVLCAAANACGAGQ